MPSSDPEQALAARLVKDRIHADRVAALALACGFPVMEVDGVQPPEAIYRQVERLFTAVLGKSKRTDLTAVRRWENDNKAHNLRAWISTGDVPSAAGWTFPFSCECGVFGCSAEVSLTLHEVEDPYDAILAPGHGQ